jgi:hypothetical protein
VNQLHATWQRDDPAHQFNDAGSHIRHVPVQNRNEASIVR